MNSHISLRIWECRPNVCSYRLKSFYWFCNFLETVSLKIEKKSQINRISCWIFGYAFRNDQSFILCNCTIISYTCFISFFQPIAHVLELSSHTYPKETRLVWLLWDPRLEGENTRGLVCFSTTTFSYVAEIWVSLHDSCHHSLISNWLYHKKLVTM